jgi:dTMP kinase
MSRGKFITLEGLDGAGKSTHASWLAERLRERGLEVVLTREPGGTPLGEKLRSLLLSEPMHMDTETLLMFAARREHLVQVIMPALEAGKWVISDRFTDATYAYQGGGRRMSLPRIAVLEGWTHPDLQPDLTFIFDVPLALAVARRGGRAAGDRFESQDWDFFQRVRDQYLSRARKYPERVRLIDADRTLADIQVTLEDITLTL